MGRSLVILLTLLCASACRAPAAPEDRLSPAGRRVAALPLRDLTADPTVGLELTRRLHGALAARGFRFVPGGDLDDLLRAHRIRQLDSLDAEARAQVAAGTGADRILMGTLLAFEATPEPVLSVAVRLLDAETGRRMRSSVVSLRGSDFAGLLALGGIVDVGELLDETVARLVDALASEQAADDAGVAAEHRAPSAWCREHFHFQPGDRLVVLPLENRSDRPLAASLFTELLAHEVFLGARVQVVERSELLEALVAGDVRSIERVDAEVLTRVGRALGSRYVMLGSLDRFDEDVPVERERLPELEASVRVLDLETGRIMAAAATRRRGDDYHVLLGLGTVRDPVALADRVARELVEALGG